MGCRATAALRLGLALAGAGLAAAGVPARGGDLDGSVRWYWGTTDVDDVENRVTEGDALIAWRQPVTRWLTVRLFGRYSLDRTTSDVAPRFERESTEPGVAIDYARPDFTARVSRTERRTRGTSAASELDTTTTLAQVDWRPWEAGPQFVLRWEDDENTPAEVSVFGRGTDSERLDFDTLYSRGHWTARYGYEHLGLSNLTTGLQLVQARHEVRATWDHAWLDDRARLAADVWVRRVDQEERRVGGSELVPARIGLYAADPSPALGVLDPELGLTDGDLDTPVAPAIDIGGASTFRNVGLDLGFTRPVDRLEVYVDGPSDPDLRWEVYRSSDNLNWFLVSGVTSSFDEALLRYEIGLPAAEARYFKAVNVTPNAMSPVLVTEMRALVSVDRLGRRDAVSTSYWTTLSATVRPHERVVGSFSLFVRDDEDAAQLGISSDRKEIDYTAQVRYAASDELAWTAGYRFSDFEQTTGLVLHRQEHAFNVSADWVPLETLRTLWTAQRREETDGGELIRATNTLAGRATMQVYEDLLVTSDLTWSDADDPFAGYRQKQLQWGERLEARPVRTWNVGAGTTVTWYDSTGTVTLDRRTSLDLFTTWQAFPYLTLTGDVSYVEDDNSESTLQRYGLLWAPGRRLSLALNHQRTASVGVRTIVGDTAALTYRMIRRLRLTASLVRSRTDEVGSASVEIVSGRVGFQFTF